MFKTPKSLRLQIGLFGRTNVGKSTFLNYIANQNVSITSSVPGTTTDVVEKAMELLPIGPVLFLDTAGIDDKSEIASLRLEKTGNVFERSDVFVLIIEPGVWGDYEEKIFKESLKQKTPVIIVVNKVDIKRPDDEFINKIEKYSKHILVISCNDKSNQDYVMHEFKRRVISVMPSDFLTPLPIIGDLIPRGGIAILIVPIDKEAPKGRIILPQVQTIRDALDNDQMTITVKESEYKNALGKLKKNPDLVVCDSQVVDKMVAATPKGVKCTTFSILFARIKGDLVGMVKAASAMHKLVDGDRILISESCSHHPIEDDIGRVKIPRWLKEYIGKDILFDSCAGRDFPDDLKKYKLIIQCGGCMITRREVLARIEKAKAQNIPITNYGVSISLMQGVLKNVLSPFPEAMDVLDN